MQILPCGGVLAVDETCDDLPLALEGGLFVELTLDGFVDVLVGVGVEVRSGGKAFYLLEEEVGEEAVVLRVEGVGCLVGGGGEEYDGVAVLVGFALRFLGLGVGIDLVVGTEHEGAVALVAVEGGIDDDGEAADGVGLALTATFEGGAEGIERDALFGKQGGFLAREGYVVDGRLDDILLFLAAAFLAAEGFDAVEAEVVGDEVGVAVEVGGRSPHGARGLKLLRPGQRCQGHESLPAWGAWIEIL